MIKYAHRFAHPHSLTVLPLLLGTASCGMVIAVTVLFEMVHHKVHHYVCTEAGDLNSKLFQELLHKLNSELMILGEWTSSTLRHRGRKTNRRNIAVGPSGFISFTVMMLLESHVLTHGSPWVVGFEFAHIAIFFIVCSYRAAQLTKHKGAYCTLFSPPTLCARL
jgi:hypothetical protein